MKNKMIQGGKQIIVLLLACCLLSGSIPLASAKNLPHGWAGKKVRWQYNPASQTLTFSGKGGMYVSDDVEGNPFGHPEYHAYKKGIKTVVFEQGITSVGIGCCYNMKNLTKVRFSKSIKWIKEGAFKNCVKLKNVTLPPHLKSIGTHAFYNTAVSKLKLPEGFLEMQRETFRDRQLKTLNFPKSMKIFPQDLYYRNQDLKTYHIPAHMEELASGAFMGCDKLKSVTINKNLKKIGFNAFSGCKKLESVKLPENAQLTEIGLDAFEGCSRLKSIRLPDTVKEIDQGAFMGCKALKEVKLPENLEAVQGFLFAKSGVECITIPSKVEEIHRWAFLECNKLKEIHIKSEVKDNVRNYSFGDVPEDCVIYVPAAKVEQYRGMFQKSGLDPNIQIIGE